MRVLQLIDSLETGGAERVAVNLANALSHEIEKSFLCTTRKEGLLKESLLNEVGYLFLNKQKTIDYKAISALNAYVKANNINIIHAHSSSFFVATLIKFLNKNVNVVWHDHYGNSEFLENRKYGVLKLFAKYFSHIFSVNKALETWARENLKAKNVTYLPNFATIDRQSGITNLSGVSGKRIICLANLRPQKDQMTLIDAFKIVVEHYPDWTLHVVGKDFQDAYSEDVKHKIDELDLKESVYLLGSKPDVFHILEQCDIGVLSSKSEGLPIALLEYGLANLTVIATRVGECESVIKHDKNGMVVNALDTNALAHAIMFYIENEENRKTHAKKYNKHIQENFSEKFQLKTMIEIYNQII
jgi:glycosyltransferase involved in cell wall biosynthesis